MKYYNILNNKIVITKKGETILSLLNLKKEDLISLSEQKLLDYVNIINEKTDVRNILDKQSGELTSGGIKPHKNKVYNKGTTSFGKDTREYRTVNYESNSGGASRILHKCNYEAEEYDIINYCAKVSSSERNAGCNELKSESKKHLHSNPKCLKCNKRKSQTPLNVENYDSKHWSCACESPKWDMSITEMKNNHPTLKPISLIQRVLKLFKLPIKDQKLYIPFSGVSSEYIGAIFAGFKEENITACEINPEYVEIGNARIKYWKKLRKQGYSFDNKEELTKKIKKRIKPKHALF